MAGGVGVVAEADVYAQPGQRGGGMMGGTPASWATIWFVVALVYLVGIYLGMINIGR